MVTKSNGTPATSDRTPVASWQHFIRTPTTLRTACPTHADCGPLSATHLGATYFDLLTLPLLRLRNGSRDGCRFSRGRALAGREDPVAHAHESAVVRIGRILAQRPAAAGVAHGVAGARVAPQR